MGAIDEVRVSKTRRSDAWIAACYLSQSPDLPQSDGLLQYGSIETLHKNWLAGWRQRRKITVDGSQIDAPLTNFPLLVRLDENNFNFETSHPDGYDVRFTNEDGATLMPHERELHDSSARTASYWVRVPEVASGEDTVIYVYGDNDDASDGSYAAGVWDEHQYSVYHLSSTNGVTQGDLSTTGKPLNLYGSPSEGEAGVISRCVRLAGSPQYMATPSFPNIDTTLGLTLSGWFSATFHRKMIFLGGGGNWSPYYHASLEGNETTGRLIGSASGGTGNSSLKPDYGPFAKGVWTHVAMSVYYDSSLDQSQGRMYFNGTEVTNVVIAGRAIRNPFTSRPLVIGAEPNKIWPPNAPLFSIRGWWTKCAYARSAALPHGSEPRTTTKRLTAHCCRSAASSRPPERLCRSGNVDLMSSNPASTTWLCREAS